MNASFLGTALHPSAAVAVADPVSPCPENSRLDYLDATRAFALVLGIVFHASLSFVPTFMGWAVQDVSTSPLAAAFVSLSHSFRMEAFFLLAGFFSHMTFHRQRVVPFVRTRALRIVVPFVVGWFILRPLTVSGWIMGSASLRGDYDFWTGIRAGFETLRTLPTGLFTGSHLWFLYYLAMITALTLVFRGLLTATGSRYAAIKRRSDALVAWLANSRPALPILVAPTVVVLWFMRFWGVDTPDQSLQPDIPVVVLYGSFFVLGWLLDRQPTLVPHFARLSAERWIMAGIGMAGTLLTSGIQTDPGHPYYIAAHVGFVVSYAMAMWSLVFLTIGIFKKLCARPRGWIRYVADSSYWLYLVHLPIVVWLQVAVAELPFNWTLKLAFVCAATLVTALLSYDLFVRSTMIGAVLNGRRHARALFAPGSNERRNAPILNPRKV